MPIEITHGRATTTRTVEELEQNAASQFENLTPKEQRAVLLMLKEAGGDHEILAHLTAASHWERIPVSMKQFLEDEYYMGIPGSSLYPKIKEDLIRLFDDPLYSEVLLLGSLGWGKSTYASFVAARMLYEISCLRDPARSFGLSPGSEIHLALISKNLEQTRKTLRQKIIEPMRLSPYFMEHFAWKERPEEDVFPRNVVMFIASINSLDRVLGSNLFGALIDEMNFLGAHSMAKVGTVEGAKGMAAVDKADRMYHLLMRRIKSRFNDGGRLPGKLVLISSKTVKGSFTDRRVAAAKSDPSVLVLDYATWDVKPISSFSGKWFRVLVGGEAIRPRVLNDGEVVPDLFLAETGSYVIDVPEEFRPEFESDILGALRDTAGVSTEALSQFIYRQETIFNAVDESRNHPFTVETWVYGTPGEFKWSELANSTITRDRWGYDEVKWRPIRNPDAGRYIHIDVGLSGDALGISMGHITRMVSVMRTDQSGAAYQDVAPEFEIDFMLRIKAKDGEQIFLPDVRGMVYSLQEHGFNIIGFSCDSFQSAEMIQQVKARGIAASVVSVDRTMDPYTALRQALYEGRLKYYLYGPLIEELKFLEYDGLRQKVDHQVGGAKDVSDAVAGVIHGLLTKNAQPIAPLLNSDLPAGHDGVSSIFDIPDDDDLRWVTHTPKRK